MEIAVDDAFGHWLAGFADGEGSFTISRANGCWLVRFAIRLRVDDIAILKEIQRRTGLGLVMVAPGRGAHPESAKWEVYRKAEVAQLAALFRRYPLRAKKARDFAIWCEAIKVRAARRNRSRDWAQLEALAEALKAIRRFETNGIAEEIPSPQLELLDGVS